MDASPTKDMKIPTGYRDETWTLAEAVASMRKAKITGLLVKSDDEISEEYTKFQRAVRAGHSPTNGGVLAAYYLAVLEELEGAYWERDEITRAQYNGRLAAASRLVFRKTYKI